jgi:hypothetical protein
MYKQGRTGSPNFGGIFFRRAPKKIKKNAAKTKKLKKKKKKSLNKDYKGAVAAAQTENSHELR